MSFSKEFFENKKIYVAGHTGLVGSALIRALKNTNAEIMTKSHSALDLCDKGATDEWMADAKPDIVIMAAGKVGGIGANADYPADFLSQNLSMGQNVIDAAFKHDVKKIVYLGSSCIYPKNAQQPIREEYLLTGSLEPTNEAYAIAKITCVKLCQFYKRQYGRDFISVMPCNLYGVGDRWASEAAHVIPALISRIYQAKIDSTPEVVIWGTGKPLREFLYADDLAEGILIATQNYNDELPLNIGSGTEMSIADLAYEIAKVVGYEGVLRFNINKPDGVFRKLLDSSNIRNFSWQPRTSIQDGLKLAYEDFLESVKI